MKGRLWGLRLVGIALMIGSVYIVWYTTRGGATRPFWRNQFGSRVNIYKDPGTWLADGKSKTKLERFRNRPAIVSFVYADCAVTCPRIMHDLKVLHAKLQKQRPEFLIFLFDEKPPTVAKVAEFRKRYALEGGRWHVLWGPPKTLKRLADEFRLGYSVEAGGYIHSNFYAVAGPDGKVRREFRGLSVDVKRFIEETAEALR